MRGNANPSAHVARTNCEARVARRASHVAPQPKKQAFRKLAAGTRSAAKPEIEPGRHAALSRIGDIVHDAPGRYRTAASEVLRGWVNALYRFRARRIARFREIEILPNSIAVARGKVNMMLNRRGKLIKGSLLALSVILAAPGALPAAANLIVNSDFESGAIDTGFWAVSGNAPTITTEVTRSGKYALKTFLDRKNSKVSYRTELTSGGRERVVPGQDYWYGFSVYLPDSYVPDNIWEIVAQWHSAPDNDQEAANNLNPPLSLHSGNGEWRVSTIWDTNAITDKTKYTGKRNYSLGKYATGRWTDWVFHIRWSHKSDGLLQVWKDGKKVIDVTGPIGFNDKKGPYFKMGLYKGWDSRTEPKGNVATRTLYHDEVRIAGPGGRYEDVAPGGAVAVRRPAAPQSVMIEQQ